MSKNDGLIRPHNFLLIQCNRLADLLLIVASLLIIMMLNGGWNNHASWLALPMLLIAIAIKLESPGPAIYRQRRHGLDGQEFTIYKFRSMTIESTTSEYR